MLECLLRTFMLQRSSTKNMHMILVSQFVLGNRERIMILFFGSGSCAQGKDLGTRKIMQSMLLHLKVKRSVTFLKQDVVVMHTSR